MKWYEPLIWEEFIEYFSNPDTCYYEVVDEKRVCDQMFLNYYEVVDGLTLAHIVRDCGLAKDFLPKEEVSEYKYKAYCHFMEHHKGVVFQKEWQVRFCSFFRDLKIKTDELSTDQLALCIMYPFWERWGSNFIDNSNPKSGRLAEAVLKLWEKHNQENN